MLPIVGNRTESLVYNNHPIEAAASLNLAIILIFEPLKSHYCQLDRHNIFEFMILEHYAEFVNK